MATGTVPSAEVKREHHLSLDNEIQCLDALRRQILRLRDKINGSDSDKPPTAETVEPSLAQVLGEGSQTIRGYHNSCRDLVNEIEGLLFG